MDAKRITSKLKKLLAKLDSMLLRAHERWMPSDAAWQRLEGLIWAVGLGLILAFLLLSVGCVALQPDAPSKTLTCPALPLEQLEPTREPPMNDSTGDALLTEAAELRIALRLCNKDKQRFIDTLKEEKK